MNNQNIDVLLENQSLKFEFSLRNLDLTQVFWATPDDLKRENRFLRHLLVWVQRYSDDGNRQRMEAEGYDFPPIESGISPENDWYRFERWMQGKPIRQKLKDQLPSYYAPKSPEQLNDEALMAELETLVALLAKIHISADFGEEIPPRLVYTHLLASLEDEFDIVAEGFWHLDGCTGYCPGCFQRPWCETGGQSCWPEDEQAGKMCLVDAVKDYVSASPISLSLLQEAQAEEDRQFAEFEQKHNNRDIRINSLPFDSDFDFDDEDGIPF